MNRLFGRTLCLALFMSLTGCAASDAQTEVRASYNSPGSQISVSYFYDNLADDGEWFEDPRHGWCWTPYDMSADWRPYYDGHWVYTDYGWSWASNERWGWATYHYGRWMFDDSYGWVWVPGTEWAPAWVAWRYSDDYIGWAPLPPSAGWNLSVGLTFGDANSIPYRNWSFVPQTQILDVSLRLRVISVARNVTLFQRSRDVTRFEVRDGRPVNLGIDVALVEKSVKRPVKRVKIVDTDTPARGNGRRIGRDNVGYYRPAIQPASPDQAPAPEVRTRREAIPDGVVQRQREAKQRKLDNDFKAERARLAREQKSDLRTRREGAAAEEIRARHAAEQQALKETEEQQRKVLDQRMQKKIVKPEKGKAAGKPKDEGKGGGRGGR